MRLLKSAEQFFGMLLSFKSRCAGNGPAIMLADLLSRAPAIEHSLLFTVMQQNKKVVLADLAALGTETYMGYSSMWS